MARLIEFQNHKGELLRGILDEAPDMDRAVVFYMVLSEQVLNQNSKGLWMQ